MQRAKDATDPLPFPIGIAFAIALTPALVQREQRGLKVCDHLPRLFAEAVLEVDAACRCHSLTPRASLRVACKRNLPEARISPRSMALFRPRCGPAQSTRLRRPLRGYEQLHRRHIHLGSLGHGHFHFAGLRQNLQQQRLQLRCATNVHHAFEAHHIWHEIAIDTDRHTPSIGATAPELNAKTVNAPASAAPRGVALPGMASQSSPSLRPSAPRLSFPAATRWSASAPA